MNSKLGCYTNTDPCETGWAIGFRGFGILFETDGYPGAYANAKA